MSRPPLKDGSRPLGEVYGRPLETAHQIALTRGKAKAVLNLFDTRAADELEIEFDFHRDGYVLRMDRTSDEEGYIKTLVGKQEVGFIPAWNMKGAK